MTLFKAIVNVMAVDLYSFSRIARQHNGTLSITDMYVVNRYLLISRLAQVIEVQLGFLLHSPRHLSTLPRDYPEGVVTQPDIVATSVVYRKS